MRTLLRRKFCKCGCGQQITSKRKGVEFIWGHHSRCMGDEIIQKRANSIKKSYEHRDGYWKGKKRPLETGIKIAEAHRGMKYRVKVKLLRRKLCACGCGQPLGEKYELDHRMPIALGGENTDDNMQLLTRTCNRQKHAKHPVEFMKSRGFLL